MVDINKIKEIILQYYEGSNYGNIGLVYQVFDAVPELLEEIESLRKDLAEMYEVTKGKNNAYKTK